METNENSDGKTRNEDLNLPGTPKAAEESASGSWIAGAIQRFKESQRLPLLSRLLEAKGQPAPAIPADLELGNFYHL